ncbi:MAG: MFS transporter [Bacillota bacterium]
MIWRADARWLKMVVALLLVAAAVTLYSLSYYLQFNPFKTEYRMKSASCLYADSTGNLWLVDGGRRISRINSDYQVDRIIAGGEGSSYFFMCDNITSDSSGNLYATNIFISGTDERYYKQQLIRMNEYGTVQEVLYQADYDKDNVQRRICDIQANAEQVVFYDVDDRVARKICYNTSTKKCAVLGEFKLLNSHWSTVVGNPQTGATEIAYLTGEVISYVGTKETNIIPPGQKVIPLELHCSALGNSYFFDAGSQEVLEAVNDKLKSFIDKGQLQLAFSNDCFQVVGLELGDRSAHLVAENQVATFDNTGKFVQMSKLKLAPLIIVYSLMGWAALLTLSVAALALLAFIYIRFLRRMVEQAVFPVLLGVLPIIVAAVFIVSSIYADNTSNEQREIRLRIESMTSCLSSLVDAELLKQAAAHLNYDDADYQELDKLLKAVVKNPSNEDFSFYGGIYLLENNTIKTICSSAEDNIIGYKLPRIEENKYLYDAADNQHKVTATTDDSDGGWLCSVRPVLDKDGTAVGLVEVDCDLSMINYVNHANILLSLVKLISLLYVTILLTYELSGLFKTKTALNAGGVKIFSDIASIRQLAFISYFAMRFVSGFMALLVSRYALSQSGISFEFAVGLAYSLDYTAAILVNAKAGLIASKYGWKPQFIIGMLVFAVSTAISVYAPNLPLFLAGQAIGGLAFSLVHSALTTYINSETDEDKRAHNRPGYSSGEYSGTICGLLIGLWLYDRAGVELSCLVSIGAALITAALIMLCAENRFDKSSEQFATGNIFKALKIAFADRETALFFSLVLVPVTLLIAEPLFIIQLFVTQSGFNIMNIGWGQLISEFAIVYLSGALINYCLARYSIRNTIIFGCMLLVVGHLTAAIGYSLFYMYIGMFVLGFGYAITHTAFAEYYLGFKPATVIGRQTMAACADTVMSLSFMFSYSLIGKICGTLGLRNGWLVCTGLGAGMLLLFWFTGLWRKKKNQTLNPAVVGAFKKGSVVAGAVFNQIGYFREFSR